MIRKILESYASITGKVNYGLRSILQTVCAPIIEILFIFVILVLMIQPGDKFAHFMIAQLLRHGKIVIWLNYIFHIISICIFKPFWLWGHKVLVKWIHGDAYESDDIIFIQRNIFENTIFQECCSDLNMLKVKCQVCWN